jgi:hypothetical protein
MKLFRAFSSFQEKLSSLNLPKKKSQTQKLSKKNQKKREAGRTNNSFIMWK